MEIVGKETSLISEFVGFCVAFDRESAKWGIFGMWMIMNLCLLLEKEI
jgi:hypothetical protein